MISSLIESNNIGYERKPSAESYPSNEVSIQLAVLRFVWPIPCLSAHRSCQAPAEPCRSARSILATAIGC
jgi:hypothetical protein